MLKEEFLSRHKQKLFHTGLTSSGNPTHPKWWKYGNVTFPVFKLISDFNPDNKNKYTEYMKNIRMPYGPIQFDQFKFVTGNGQNEQEEEEENVICPHCLRNEYE